MTIELFLTLSAFATVVAGAVVVILSNMRKARTNEAVELANTRGEKIDDLRREIADMKAEHEGDRLEVRLEMAKMSGQIEELRERQTREIIDGVVDGLRKQPLGGG